MLPQGGGGGLNHVFQMSLYGHRVTIYFYLGYGPMRPLNTPEWDLICGETRGGRTRFLTEKEGAN